jgi:hypothetical protein
MIPAGIPEPVVVLFTGVYDHANDELLGDLVQSGASVGEAWVALACMLAEQRKSLPGDFTYDDWRAA